MSAPAIDLAAFRALQTDAGADFVDGLLDTFFEEGPKMLDALRAAHDQRDAVSLKRTAHSLKSNGATFGATALAALAREIELHGLPDDAGAAAHALDALNAAYAHAHAALEDLRRG